MLRAVTQPIPTAAARSIAICIARRATTMPDAPSPSSIARVGVSRRTRTSGLGLSRPSLIMLQYPATRVDPWDSTPRRSASTRTSAIVSASDPGPPRLANSRAISARRRSGRTMIASALSVFVAMARYCSRVGDRVTGLARRHPDAVAVIALSLLPFAIFAHALWPGRVLSPADILMTLPPWASLAPGMFAANPLQSDVAFMFDPWLIYAGRAVAAGHFPLWNPYA